MAVEWQDVAIAVTSAASGIIGWFVRVLWDAVETQRRDLADLQKSLPHVYARRDDLKEMFHQLLEAIARLDKKMDDKADKE